MFLRDTWLWHRWALADPAWATCHDFCHRTTLLQQLSISSPLNTNLPDFSGADEEHSHDQAMRALSTWIKPFLKWLFIPSRPNSTTQGLLQHFHPKELPCPLSGFSYCLPPYLCHTFNKFLTFNAAKAFFTVKHPWIWSLTCLLAQPYKQLKGQVSACSTGMGTRSQELFELILTMKHLYSQNTAYETVRQKQA